MPQQRDSKRAKPLYEKTYEALRATILSGEILPGELEKIRSDNPQHQHLACLGTIARSQRSNLFHFPFKLMG